MGVSPPHSSGSSPFSLISCFTLSMFAPSLSICKHVRLQLQVVHLPRGHKALAISLSCHSTRLLAGSVCNADESMLLCQSVRMAVTQKEVGLH